MLGHELVQKCQPIHAGHLDVQSDHIGHEAAQLLRGHIGIGRRLHPADARIRREDVGQGLSDHRRVIDHQHGNLVVHDT
jgi:hypothetical protein